MAAQATIKTEPAVQLPVDLTPKPVDPQAAIKESLAQKLAVQREKDKEMVKGIFRFHEVPGGKMGFSYKAYKGDKVERFDLTDGQIYTLPLGVAKHLNKNVYYPIHSHALDENGFPTAKIGQKVRRCSFQSLEFVDVDEMPPLVTVEFMNNKPSSKDYTLDQYNKG
jgi:hypothetical protein